MTSVLILIATTTITSLYAFLITALADKHPELAGLLSLVVVVLWLLIGFYFIWT